MATLFVRNCPDELYQAVQSLAAEEQRSLSGEILVLLEDGLDLARARKRQTVAMGRIAERRRRMRAPQDGVDAVTLLREDRER
jgi:hypothetical protein